MPDTPSRLDELIAVRKREREEEQVRHTMDMAAKVEAALGGRVVAALANDGAARWELNGACAQRRFLHRRGEFHLVVTAIQGAGRVDLELRHADTRFAALAKKTGLADVSEDWFLNALEMLSTQIGDRLQNPKNFA